MKRKLILMLLLLSGLLSSGCARLAVDYITTHDYVYINETSQEVMLCGYMESGEATDLRWRIAPGSTLTITVTIPGSELALPNDCDYVIVVFDGIKELKVAQGEGFMKFDQRKVGKRYFEMVHRITQAMYEAATLM